MKTGVPFIDKLLKELDESDKSSSHPEFTVLKWNSEDVPLTGNSMSTSGHLKGEDGTKLACFEKDINASTFEPRVRLMVPAETFGNLEVTCDGNALEIHTETNGDGRYTVKRKLRGFKPAIMEDEFEVKLPEIESTKEFIAWIEKLPKDMVEAYRQIYFDKWNFDTGNSKDKIYYELLDEEYKGRE